MQPAAAVKAARDKIREKVPFAEEDRIFSRDIEEIRTMIQSNQLGSLNRRLRRGIGMVKNIKAPKGTQLNCKGWLQEAAYRMIQNNLDGEVAEIPDELIVYGGKGKAARNWDCYNKILSALKELEDDETLLVQSGKPVAVIKTHEDAPKVLIANSNLVGNWANWDHFNELEKQGLMMYGQMTAGSWIYIGSQGIVQGTYETFVEAGRKHFGGDLKGRVIFTSGLGGMGGAQPLAGVFAGACVLAVEVDETRIQKRLDTGYVDEVCHNLDEAWQKVKDYAAHGEAKSIALVGNGCEVISDMVVKGYVPDIVTDQTSAHDPLLGYIPEGLSLEQADELREKNQEEYLQKAMRSMRKHVEGMLTLQKKRRGNI